MQSIALGKARAMMALLLIGLAVGAGFVCQIHTSPLDHGHATPGTSHAHSSAYSFLDFSCIGMAAILPTLMMFRLVPLPDVACDAAAVETSVFAFPPSFRLAILTR